MAAMRERAGKVRRTIESFGPIADDARMLEVGCGPGGHLFFFGTRNAVGVDPLALEYARLFSAWYPSRPTVAAFGERLPFPPRSFDLLLCDNVVDHALDPRAIVEEMVRVLAPGGRLYFAVNVHHRVYSAVSSVYAAWRVLCPWAEIAAFADHTCHLAPEAASALFDGLPLRRLCERTDVEEVSSMQRANPSLRPRDLVQRKFFKNARYELVASRL